MTIQNDAAPSLYPEASPASLILVFVAMASVTYGMGRYAYGLFLPAIRQDFDLDTVDLALIASLNTIAYLLANIIASATAIHVRPRTFILSAGVVTTLGLLMTGFSTSFPMAATGIILAGVGGGIYSPALFEAIDAWLSPRWRMRAIGAVNAGATPGLILTGLAAFWMQSVWQQAWLVMAAIGGVVTLLSLWLVPNVKISQGGVVARLPLELGLFIRPACVPLYIGLFVYGLLLSTYLTFAVDLIISTGGMTFPTDRLFWVLLGLAGLPNVFTGEFVRRYGVRMLLAVSMPLCGLSYLLLAIAPGNETVVLASAILFGATSIAPGNGFLVWGIGLFRERPSVGSGTVFFVLSIAVIVGPILFGLASGWIATQTFFLLLALISLAVVPLFPKEEAGVAPPG